MRAREIARTKIGVDTWTHFRSENVLADRAEEEEGSALLGSARSPGARPRQPREGPSLVTRGEAGASRAVTPTIQEEPAEPEERDRLL